MWTRLYTCCAFFWLFWVQLYLKQFMYTVGYNYNRKCDYYLLCRWWCSCFASLIVPCLVLRCPVLYAPPNGKLHDYSCGNIYGSVCRIECNIGFTLKGSNLRKCDKRDNHEVYWTGAPTICQSKKLILRTVALPLLLRISSAHAIH